METKTAPTKRSVFTPAEIAYLRSQRLGRLATVGADGQPHVVPVGFRYNPEQSTIDIGGHGFAKRKKFRDVRSNPRVAIVVGDLASVNPWRPRGIEVRANASVYGAPCLSETLWSYHQRIRQYVDDPDFRAKYVKLDQVAGVIPRCNRVLFFDERQKQ